MESTDQRRVEEIRRIKDRLRVLESSMKKIESRPEEESPTVAPPSSDSQSDDLAVNLESMSDREHQA